jgi:hypothetical protein
MEEAQPDDEYSHILSVLKDFNSQYDNFKTKNMSSLMNSLSEIISMNPTYSQDKMTADKLLSFLFSQYWSNFLTREE